MSRFPQVSLACILVLMIASAALCAKGKGPIYTDPAKAGPDYAVQGEYLGKLASDGAEQQHGGQVIALGEAKFRLVLYTGGLPGDGWKRGDSRQKVEGATTAGQTTFQSSELSATIKEGVLTVSDAGGTKLGQLKRVQRKSSTLGAKPPQGAAVLFDGTTAEHFHHGKMTPDKLLMAGCWSKQKFGDHSLHIEFRPPFKPHARGQDRGNSGVYVQGRYEVQVLDSFGLEGASNECGGIYAVKQPAVNMCYPPLTWQTYDIDFTAVRYGKDDKKIKNARITVRHNGVVIQDDVEIPRGTPGHHGEGPGPDDLFLQGHGNPVVYRNVWAVEKK